MADSLASQIITAIGGPENVRSLTHCATRLRFELVDASKVDQNSLEHMQGVLGAVPQSGDRFQVVIGGGVATVYENIMHLPEMAGVGGASASDDGQKSNADVKAEARSKARGKVAWLDSFFEYLSDSFRPILGVLLGASIIIALVNLLISLNVIPNDEVSAGWVFVKAIWKGVFYFLPIMVAYNASKKLKVDPWLGGAIMAMLMTPQFTGLMDAKTTTCVENAALGTKSCMANIFGLPMALSDYSGNVFVPLLMAAVLALVYHGLKRIIPESVQLVNITNYNKKIIDKIKNSSLLSGLRYGKIFLFLVAVQLLYVNGMLHGDTLRIRRYGDILAPTKLLQNTRTLVFTFEILEGLLDVLALFYRHDNHNSLLFLLFFTLISNGSCLVSGRDSIRTTPTPRSVCLSRLLVP